MSSNERTTTGVSRRRQLLFGVLWVGLGLVVLAGFGGACLVAVSLFSDPPGRISVTEPRDNTTVSSQRVVIRGTSSPAWAGVYRVLPAGGKQPVPVDEDGNWFYVALLQEGRNTFTFHLDSQYGQSDSITITYTPGGP